MWGGIAYFLWTFGWIIPLVAIALRALVKLAWRILPAKEKERLSAIAFVAFMTYGKAADFGIIGIALWLAIWIMFFPFMAIFCVVLGLWLGTYNPEARRLSN